jgi:uncharacterized membrane protein YGL010W
MANYFHHQLGYYADAHRDPVNSVMHMIGNPTLFMAVVLPLSLLPVSVLGVEMSAAPLLTIPALILRTSWDIAIGLAIVVTSVPLLFAASAIAGRVSILWVWVTAVGLFVLGWALQIVGHQLFEGKRPNFARQSRSDADQPNVYLRQAFRRARLPAGSCGRFAKIVPADAA